MTQFQLLLSQPRPDVLVFGMSGELDLATAHPFKEAAKTATADGYRALVFDLSHLDFMDSTGLHVLAEAHRKMAAQGREAVVVCSSPLMLRVFELTGLDRMLTIVATREHALDGFMSAA